MAKTNSNRKKTTRSTPKAGDSLPPKKRKYVQGRLKGKSKFRAATDAGYSANTAKNASRDIETEDVNRELRTLLVKAVPLSRIVKIIDEGCEATKLEFAKHNGKIKDVMEVVDHGMRKEYAKLRLQLTGEKTTGGEIEGADGKVKVRVLIDC
jgi:phage terminase small subunit